MTYAAVKVEPCIVGQLEGDIETADARYGRLLESPPRFRAETAFPIDQTVPLDCLIHFRLPPAAVQGEYQGGDVGRQRARKGDLLVCGADAVENVGSDLRR